MKREEKISGYLEVGTNLDFEVVVNLDRDRDGIGHLVFSPNQARQLSRLLTKMAKRADEEYKNYIEKADG